MHCIVYVHLKCTFTSKYIKHLQHLNKRTHSLLIAYLRSCRSYALLFFLAASLSRRDDNLRISSQTSAWLHVEEPELDRWSNVASTAELVLPCLRMYTGQQEKLRFKRVSLLKKN